MDLSKPSERLIYYQIMLKEAKQHLAWAKRSVNREKDMIAFYERKIDELTTGLR